MKLRTIRPPRSFDHPGALLVIFAVLLCVAGCVISPRRVVVTPSPTPTPDISPTPTPTPTATPTPTPTGANKTVPQTDELKPGELKPGELKPTGEFLFLGDAQSPLLTGFRINPDGSLAPLPGSPFPISAPARSLKALHNLLIAETKTATTTFTVNQETGLLQQTGSMNASIPDSDLAGPVSVQTPAAVLDSSGTFMYVVDRGRAELLAYRVDSGKISALSQATYPVSTGATSIVLVKP